MNAQHKLNKKSNRLWRLASRVHDLRFREMQAEGAGLSDTAATCRKLLVPLENRAAELREELVGA